MYGSWIYSYLCNVYHHQKLWVRTQFTKRCTDTTLCDKACQWLATGQWFSPVSSTSKTDRHNNWNILESGVKHHKPTNHAFKMQIALFIKEIHISLQHIEILFITNTDISILTPEISILTTDISILTIEIFILPTNISILNACWYLYFSTHFCNSIKIQWLWWSWSYGSWIYDYLCNQ